MSMPRVVPLLILILALSGCEALFMRRFVEPEEGADLRHRRVLVIPFREGDGWYGESRFGNQLRLGIAARLQRECTGTKFLSGEEEAPILTEIVEWLEDDEVPWSFIGRQYDLDYIVFGEVERVSFERQNLIGMLHGSVVLSLRVWNVSKEEMTFARSLSFAFPDDPEYGEILPSFEQNEGQISRQLIIMAAKETARICCGEIEDIR